MTRRFVVVVLEVGVFLYSEGTWDEWPGLRIGEIVADLGCGL